MTTPSTPTSTMKEAAPAYYVSDRGDEGFSLLIVHPSDYASLPPVAQRFYRPVWDRPVEALPCAVAGEAVTAQQIGERISNTFATFIRAGEPPSRALELAFECARPMLAGEGAAAPSVPKPEAWLCCGSLFHSYAAIPGNLLPPVGSPVPLYARPTPAAGVPPGWKLDGGSSLEGDVMLRLSTPKGDRYNFPTEIANEDSVRGCFVRFLKDMLAARPLPGGVPTGLSQAANELADAAQAAHDHRFQMGAPMLPVYEQLRFSVAKVRAALSAGAPSSQEPTDAQMLDWLEAWHGIAGKPEGYGDTGIAYIDRVSDGFMLDDELGGGTFEKLRDALRAAMKESPHG